MNQVWRRSDSKAVANGSASRHPVLQAPRAGDAVQAVTQRPLIVVVHDRRDDVPALADGLQREGYMVATQRLAPEVQPPGVVRRPHGIVWRNATLAEGMTVWGEGVGESGAPYSPAMIFLVDQGSEEERVAALDRGIDDVVVLPVSVREFAARVRAVLRRTHPGVYRSLLTVDDIVLDTASARATHGGVPLSLTKKEFRLLQAFMQYPDRVFSRQQLIWEVWGDGLHVEPRTVDVHIRRLRGAFASRRFEIIRTVRGAGYALGSNSPGT